MSIQNHEPISFNMLSEDIEAIKVSQDVSSSSLLSSLTPAVDWALKKVFGKAPKSGAFAIRNHAFEAEAPKSGAYAIRNHAFEAEVPKSGAYAIRNHAFETEAPKSGAFAIRNHAFAMGAA